MQPRLYIFSFSLMSVAGFVSVKNTLCQVQLWRTLQYVNQIGLNACMSRARQHQSAAATNQQFSQYNFWCFTQPLLSSSSSSGAQRYRVKGMQIYPLPSSPPPSANTDSPRPVPGLSICRTSDRSYASFSPCSLPNKLRASLSPGCMYEAV